MRQTAVYIDNRIDHIIDFEKPEIKRTYVVSGNRLNKQELIRFYTKDTERKSVLFQTDSSVPANMSVCIESQATSEIGDNEFEINATLNFKPFDPNAPETAEQSSKKIPEQGIPFIALSNMDENDDRLALYIDLNRADLRLTKARINLKFTTPDESAGHYDYESKLELYFSPQSEIYDVVIDFGSEASQIISAQRNMEVVRSDRRDVFDDMRDVVNKPESNRKKYDQFDNSDRTLYKSVFYVKSSIGDLANAMEKYPVAPIYQNPAYGDTENSTLQILTSKDESNSMLAFDEDLDCSSFIRLPNIKLAQFGGVSLPRIKVKKGPRTQMVSINSFQDNYFYRACLNHFILSALKGLDENVRAVSIHILMPNVYDHFGVTTNLEHIRRDVADIISNNPSCIYDGEEYDLLKNIKAVEVDMMFESDASFLGLMTKLNSELNEYSLGNGNYLILDAGKGTLDYSVVNLIGREFLNICHGGIIGAGNALTTAYIFALFHDYVTLTTRAQDLSLEDLIELVYTKVLGASDIHDDLKWNKNLAKINEMVNAVENYKAACNGNYVMTDPQKSSNASRGIEDLSIEEFILHVNGKIDGRILQKLTDKAQTYVDGVIDKICADVADNIELTCGKIFNRINEMDFDHGEAGRIGIDHAIFVGRGFLHKPLKSKMIEALSQKEMCHGISERTIDERMFSTNHDNMMKEVCLYVSRMLNNGKYSNINTLITTDGDNPIPENEENNKKENETKEKGSVWEFLTNLFIKIQGVEIINSRKSAAYTAKLVNGLYTTFIKPGKWSSADQPIEHLRTSQMAEGYLVTKQEGDSHIIIGGNKYEFPNNTPNGRYRLFFSADDTIYIRPENGSDIRTMQRRAVNLGNSSLALPTLFPYINNINFVNDFRDVFLSIMAPKAPAEEKQEKAASDADATAEKKDEKPAEEKKPEEKKDKKTKTKTLGSNISEL